MRVQTLTFEYNSNTLALAPPPPPLCSSIHHSHLMFFSILHLVVAIICFVEHGGVHLHKAITKKKPEKTLEEQQMTHDSHRKMGRREETLGGVTGGGGRGRGGNGWDPHPVFPLLPPTSSFHRRQAPPTPPTPHLHVSSSPLHYKLQTLNCDR